MARRKRNLVIASFLLSLVIAEVGLTRLRAPVGHVRVINQGTTPLEEVRLISGASAATIARIEPGNSALVSLAGRGVAPLSVTFSQKDNPLTNFELPDFDPAALQTEGSCLVLGIRPNECERYHEAVDPSQFTQLSDQAINWLQRLFVAP